MRRRPTARWSGRSRSKQVSREPVGGRARPRKRTGLFSFGACGVTFSASARRGSAIVSTGRALGEKTHERKTGGSNGGGRTRIGRRQRGSAAEATGALQRNPRHARGRRRPQRELVLPHAAIQGAVDGAAAAHAGA